MNDITKCHGEGNGIICPLRENCWRFICPPGTMQGYFMQMPYDEDSKKCECFFHREELCKSTE